MKKTVKLFLSMVLGTLVVGCASTPNTTVPVIEAGESAGGAPQPPQAEVSDPVPKPEARSFEPLPSRSSNSAVVALLATAQQQLERENYSASAASLERAIRITPRDPDLYYRLAQVRFVQQNYHQAEQLCRKAISLAGGNQALLSRSRALLQQAQARQLN